MSAVTDSAAALRSGCESLGLVLRDGQLAQLVTLGDELRRWNRAYNLTSVDDPLRIVSHHLLDSLSAANALSGVTVADVGTGGGFPGLPLAIACPQRHFTLIDTVDKKLRFVAHAARTLGLANVTTLHARVEALKPVQPFDAVITRAFAPLPRLCGWIEPLCDARTDVLAMKGHWPPVSGSDEAAPLPAGWALAQVQRVIVPGLEAERHLLRLAFTPPAK